MTTLQSRQVEVPEGMIDLGVGQPDATVLPIGPLARAAERCFAQNAAEDFLQYGADYGDGEHRIALARFLTSAYGTSIDPEHLFTTNGNSQGLDLVCTVFTKPGDVVVVEEPTYFFALGIFADHGLTVLGAPMDDDGIVIDVLDSMLDDVSRNGRPARFIYTIPASQNPTGVTMPAKRRADLVWLAARHETLVVADEVYQLLHYDGEPPPPMSAWTQGENIISLGTFSKILAPGVRLGWAHSSPELVERLARSGLVASGGGLNPMTSALVTEVISSSDLTVNVEALRGEYRHRVDVMDGALRSEMPPEVRWHRPSGGYFFWLRLPTGLAGIEARQRANRAGLDIREGPLFSSAGGMEEFIRLSISYYRDDQIAEGVARLGRAIRS